MKKWICLMSLSILMAECVAADTNVDFNTAPIVIACRELKGYALFGDKKEFEYRCYSVVKSYADEINSKFTGSPKDPHITVNLGDKEHFPPWASGPDYEIQGTGLIAVATPFPYRRFSYEQGLETRIRDILIPLVERLGVKDAKLVRLRSIHFNNKYNVYMVICGMSELILLV